MRNSVSPGIGKSAVRVLAAALLASAVSGCSSDVSRFGGLFSKSDNITTNSIPRRPITGLNGEAPIPSQDVAQGVNTRRETLSNRDEALNQPFPEERQVSYDPISTATANGSGARMATTPVEVQRSELADPTEGNSSKSERDVALAQPFPTSKKETTEKATPDPLTTGTTSKGGWTTFNAPSVKLKPGESVATLSKRYGVPEKEILQANGLKSASAVVPGQKIVIPTYGKPRSIAKETAEAGDIPTDKKIPIPEKTPDQVAVLPTTSSSRDKSQATADAANGKLTPADGGKKKGDKAETAATGTYVVKPGDSLAKIAKATGVSVQELKTANGMNTASLRIGQTLKVPAGAGNADDVKTASIPTGKETKKGDTKKVETASTGKQPEEYKAPISKQTVADVEKKSDVTEDAPETTGIGKYRWPVRGAVVAGYGANVEGNRNDGIDISVPEGTPIKAAENGVVIYAGNGLKELGNTVLVRHDDGTVTVYGHADALNVARGQKVTRGQELATSGMSGNAKSPKVHFEVRKNATPVNPMTFLE
ncbi:peptidoglycan DD-metalloendopeptidase family protein [Rhizobium sp. LjRoot30]|uniref:peptidoglycan DD-metalloendopeptidase family protein n=1 Tax=Rhizobium sp. LjRoot30 TaxID=3342320 RepID=UPI003ECF2047